MPYTLKTQQISVKDPDSGEYIGVDVLAEQNKESLIAEIQSEGDLQVERVDQKSAEILAAGDAQVTRINQTGTNVQNLVDQEEARAQQIVTDAQTSLNTLEAQKNTIAETVASMAELGTDTTLTTPGMAADAKAVGDVKGEVDNLGDFVYDQDSGLSTKAPAITDSASSGDIVTFESDVEGGLVSKLKGTIEPIQDLHGYDSPWPGGSGVNLCALTANTQTISGVTFTVNSDGTITMNGTATANVNFIMGTVSLPSDTYILNAFVELPSGCTINATSHGTRQATEFTDAVDGNVFLYVASGTVVSNVVVKPALYLKSVGMPTFQSYANICPIAGWTGANISRLGKNLCKFSTDVMRVDLANSSYISQPGCTLTANGTKFELTRTSSWNGLGVILGFLKSGITYTVSWDSISDNTEFRLYGLAGLEDGAKRLTPYITLDKTSKSYTFTPAKDGYYLIHLYIKNTDPLWIYKLQLELGSTVTEYEESNGATIPVSFPSEAGTVYSGTINPISGKLKSNLAMVSADDLEWHVGGSSNQLLSATIVGAATTNIFSMAEYYQYQIASPNVLPPNAYTIVNSSIYLHPNGGSTVNGNFLYSLATPIEYQCTPAEVKTLLGTNNIWLDTGTITECVYPKDTKKYIDNKSVVKAPVIINSAEGEIASFSDGAEDMPVKRLVASINPIQDLHGYDNPWPAGGGKNILNPAMFVTFPVTSYGITISYDGAGTLTINGTASQNVSISIIDYKPLLNYGLKADTQYALKANVIPNGCNIRFGIKGPGQDYFFSDSGTAVQFTQEQLDSAEYRIIFEAPSGTTVSNVVVNLMICLASETDKTFAPYANLCPISGHTGMTVTRTGKNMMDLTKWEIDSALSNTIIIQNGTMTISQYAYEERYNRFIIPKKDQYVFSLHVKTISIYNDNASFYIHAYDENDAIVSRSRVGLVSVGYESDILLTIPNTAKSIRFGEWGYGGLVELSNIQLELGSTATAYEPYTGTTTPITWETEAGTVYGGTVDMLTGKMTISMGITDLGTLNWYISGVAGLGLFKATLPGAVMKENAVGVSICSQYKDAEGNGNTLYNATVDCAYVINGMFLGADYPFVAIRDSAYSNATGAEFKTAMSGVQLCCKLATPIEYQLTPAELTTLLGTNNIWTDTGSVSVDYSADTKLFIQNAIAEALSNSSNP